MAVTFNKPRGLKYTDMCIYIDQHMSEIVVPNQNPYVESTIFEYLYHIVYALACKAGYFKNFLDYDSYSLYAATELYLSIRKKQMNAGKEVRGKIIIPVKSSLNFIKSTLFPLKVNYQRDNFATMFNPEVHTDTETLESDMKESIQKQYRSDFDESYNDAVAEFPEIIQYVLNRTPFKKDSSIFKNICISVMLTLLNDITLPNKLRNKIINKKTLENRKKTEKKLFTAYRKSADNPLLWHLDDRYSNFVKILTINIKKELSKTAHMYIHGDDLSDDLVTMIMSNAYVESSDLGEDE